MAHLSPSSTATLRIRLEDRTSSGLAYVVPSVFNRDVAPRVAEAVADAAKEAGVARHLRPVSSREER